MERNNFVEISKNSLDTDPRENNFVELCQNNYVEHSSIMQCCKKF